MAWHYEEDRTYSFTRKKKKAPKNYNKPCKADLGGKLTPTQYAFFHYWDIPVTSNSRIERIDGKLMLIGLMGRKSREVSKTLLADWESYISKLNRMKGHG